MKIQLIIIIILLLLLVGVFSILGKEFLYYKKYENARILKYVQMSDIYDDLNSGDIILFKGNSMPIAGLIGNIYYTHIGMVVRCINKLKNAHPDNDPYNNKTDLYISETNPSYEYLPRGYKMNNWYGLRPHLEKTRHNGWITNYGTDLLPLLVRIKYFPGDCFIMKLNKPLDAKKENILYSAISEKCPYPTPVQAIKILAEKKILKEQKTYARHCFQHVAYLLDKMNITNNILENNGLISICAKLAYIDGQKLNSGYEYQTPVRIVYDI